MTGELKGLLFPEEGQHLGAVRHPGSVRHVSWERGAGLVKVAGSASQVELANRWGSSQVEVANPWEVASRVGVASRVVAASQEGLANL